MTRKEIDKAVDEVIEAVGLKKRWTKCRRNFRVGSANGLE